MPDWLGNLTPSEREEWDRMVDAFRQDTVEKIDKSALVMSLVPDREHFDVKFAMELGAAIMLEKPLLAVVQPGARVPPKLALIADRILELDMDTEEGREELARAIRETIGDK